MQKVLLMRTWGEASITPVYTPYGLKSGKEIGVVSARALPDTLTIVYPSGKEYHQLFSLEKISNEITPLPYKSLGHQQTHYSMMSIKEIELMAVYELSSKYIICESWEQFEEPVEAAA